MVDYDGEGRGRGGGEVDRRRADEVGPLDDDRRAAAGRGIAAEEGGDRGRADIGELVAVDVEVPRRGGDGDVDRADTPVRAGAKRARS